MRRKNIISKILILISLILILTYIYLYKNIEWSSFDQLLYSIQNAEGTSSSVIIYGAIYVIKYFVLILTLLFLFKYIIKKYITIKDIKLYFSISILKKKFKIKIYPINKLFVSIIILIMTIIIILFKLGIKEYIDSQKIKSTIFEEYYINPKDVDVSFPNEKRNLIYIFVESLENSALSKDNGGILEKSYIPNLERLALENINFSNTDKIGGGYATTGSTWTAGAMVSQTAGVPLKTCNVNGNSYKSDNFLNGAYSIGEILNDNGYKNYLMLGSNSSFGGRKNYFEQHGNYEIYDYLWAIEEKLIPKDYFEWWGYEDSKLFEFAKDKLIDISNNNEPFNFTILTADTHFNEGYVDKNCSDEFNGDNYANSYFCSDKMIDEFVRWIQEQDFYKNTTIIIVGDHLTMRQGYFISDDDNYERTVYNVIINSYIDVAKTTNRKYSTLDLYPTTIASIGGKIEGEKLGLGTNLYSNEPTLVEKLGLDFVNEELKKKSDFYNHNLLQDDYLKLEN